MADNYTAKDASGVTQTFASKDIGSGVEAVKHVIIDPTTPTQMLGIDASGRPTVNVNGTVVVDTELPAAAVLADGAANPTTPLNGACLHVWNGATWDRLRAANTYKDQATVAIGTIATVWTPASGKKFRLMGGTISLSAAASILFEDNAAGTTIHRTPKLAVDTPYNFDLGQGRLSAAANNVLKATSSAAANMTGTLYGCEE